MSLKLSFLILAVLASPCLAAEVAPSAHSIRILAPTTPRIWGSEIQFSWTPSARTKNYMVKIWRGGQQIYREVVNSSGHTVRKVPPGKYQFSVSEAFPIPSTGRIPSSTRDRFREGERSAIHEVQVSPRPRLETVWPKGRIPYAHTPLAFSWSASIEGYAYDLSLYRRGASENQWAKVSTLRSNSRFSTQELAGVLPEGDYKWTIEAKDPETQQSVGVADSLFSIDALVEQAVGNGYIFGGYNIVTTAYRGDYGDLSSQFDANLGGLSLGAGYWFLNRLGGSFLFRSCSFALQGQTETSSIVGVAMMWRPAFLESKRVTTLFRLQFAKESTPQVVTTEDGTISQGQLGRITATPELRVQFIPNEKIVTYASAALPLNLSISGGVLGGATSRSIGGGYAFSAGITLPVAWPLSINAEGALFSDRVSYSASAQAFNGTLKGQRISLGLIYAF